MATVSKYIKIHPKVLIEWGFDSNNFISENYKIITNINEDNKKNFLSTTLLNSKSRNLVQIEPVLRKYVVFDEDYNYLQEQDYSSSPIQYDRIKIYLPTNYNFETEDYVGFYLNTFSYGFDNKKTYNISNIFYDNTDVRTGSTLLNLAIPFIYDEIEWGKYFEFEIPSINYVSNQRVLSDTSNTVIPNTINYNLTTNHEGLSQTAPIFLDFRFLTSKDTILGINYYYATSEYRMSIPQTPEFETLAVKVEESTEGDFFEIYGTYGESNENLNEFIENVYTKGRRVKIEYDVYLYEENIQTSKQTFSVEEDSTLGLAVFTKKLYYRPIMTFSNTTAAIKVTMRVVDLVDMSQIVRFTTLGIRDNIYKYGKKLISLDIGNINNLKIYNAKPEQIQLNRDYNTQPLVTEIRKVPYPLLVDVGKVITNSPKSSEPQNYKGMGLLNIIITPFDNIIQFKLGELIDNKTLQPFNLSELTKGSEPKLVFKSDSEIIEKFIFKESTNNFTLGIINFKIDENDLNVLKKIYDKGYNNFYIALEANKLKTLLYSGTFTFYEDVRFIEDGINIVDDGSLTQSNIIASSEKKTAWQPKAGRTLIIYTKSKSSATKLSSEQISINSLITESTFNTEISNLIKNEGGGVVYQSGNIIVASEISEELYRELLKNSYIDSLEVLPLKRYSNNQTSDIPTVTIQNTTVDFDDLSNENIDDDENVPGAGTV